MQSAAVRIANDNRLEPAPVPVAPAEVATLPVGRRMRDERRAWLGILVGWGVLAAVLASVVPDIAWIGLAGAGLLAAAAIRVRSRLLTVASGLICAASLFVVWTGQGGGFPFIALASAGLAFVLLGWATRLCSAVTAGLLTLFALLAVGAGLAITPEPLALLLPSVAALALGLGLTRLAINRGYDALEATYLMLWCAAVALAVLAQTQALPTASPEALVVSAILFAAAAVAWAANRWVGLLTVLALAAVFTVAATPSLAAALAESFGLDPTALSALIGGGVAAAGMALCARGLARGRTVAMVLGAGVTVLQFGLIVAADTLIAENVVVFVASLIVCALWLFALRFR